MGSHRQEEVVKMGAWQQWQGLKTSQGTLYLNLTCLMRTANQALESQSQDLRRLLILKTWKGRVQWKVSLLD